jgi:hypothetical protein
VAPSYRNSPRGQRASFRATASHRNVTKPSSLRPTSTPR